ncbi:conjugal transfer protein TraN [Sphingobium sp. TA15]|uniref:Putative exported protein n=1 Tax=Sphingobium indicum (strain DSM 16413 / CCM 7287 / MTCC 6362 / UT26 / NBRC 101211 / UT26S) TaxID=452662 RepID=D4Z8Y4_SPHIU|nr:hypothetical protein [Sphingobium indicum]BAI99066.1 putative exported protein [Sphingobium indicum UT26S]BDD66044.1 conjugal transfer protein TraN [Sphingobium sp. TA15]
MKRVSLIALLCACVCHSAQAQTLEDRARSAAAAAQAKTGSSDALQQNYVTPGMSGQPITTVDNSKSFTPTINCQKTASLLEVLIQPSSTGDIGTVRISQDTDFDGSFDKSSTLPVPVSGICANGIVSCQPGTWNQCHSFKWDVDGAKALKLTEVAMPELAGCYCVNNSCGTNLVFGNLAEVLKDLGGGMVGALTTVDPRIGVAQAQVNGPVIDYVGAQATACAADPTIGQTAYRANPAAIQGDAGSIAAGNSIFQALKGSPAGIGKAEQLRSCTIEREVTLTSATFDDIVSVSGALLGVSSCGTDCRRYRIGGTGNCSAAPPIFSARFDIHKPGRVVSARIVGMAAEDWVQGRVDGAIVGYAGKRPWLTEALPSGDCAVDGTWGNGVVIDLLDKFKAGGAVVAARVRGGKDERWGYVDVEVKVDTSCSTSERLVDLCAGYAADSACRLDDEDVDGVETFRNGVGTGLKPLPQTRLFGTDSCTVQLTRDFFKRSRSYKCVLDTGSMPEPDLSRGAYIIDHSTETLLADQMKKPDGSVTQTSSPFSLPDRGSVPACEAICKTRAPKMNTAAAPAGVVATQQNNPIGWDTFYHVCEVANVCPTGPGEEVVSACGCLDDFPEAVVMMQSVRLAGADMTCTSAVP